MIKQKKGSAWIWVLVALILVGIGVGAYFLLFSGDTGTVISAGTNAGGSIPQPPALPSG